MGAHFTGFLGYPEVHPENAPVILKNQLATENTKFTEEKQLDAVNIDFTCQVRKKKWRPHHLCALCELYGLSCCF